jgi:hypothetical protein
VKNPCVGRKTVDNQSLSVLFWKLEPLQQVQPHAFFFIGKSMHAIFYIDLQQKANIS